MARLQSVAYFFFLLSRRMEMSSTYFFANVCLILINITVVVIKRRSVYISQRRDPTSAFCASVCEGVTEAAS